MKINITEGNVGEGLIYLLVETDRRNLPAFHLVSLQGKV